MFKANGLSGLPHTKNARIKIPSTWYSFITTFCFIGRFPVAPGTLGSLAAYPIYYFVTLISQPDEVSFLLMLIAAFLFTIGWLAIDKFHEATRAYDHKSIVIDEVVGQLLAIGICYSSLVSISMAIGQYIDIFYTDICFIIAFLLFRFFDIIKPFFIGSVDRLYKNGIGVMLDDVLAGVYAAIVIYIIASVQSIFF